ncbi:GAF domain-containing sensor histidine kinase [Paenibacillus chitinolyticus]|uniref:GAF domain-containing sensor histidine kinase n=1 Tax=Paenibacillus chitinolyticus TaxID=79263 RepID=UPI00386CAB8B
MTEPRMQELVILKTIAETLNQSNELAPMLGTVLEKLLELTGFSAAWIFLSGDGPEYVFAADRQLPPALEQADKEPMKCGGCWCLERYWDGRLKNAVNILSCKRLETARKQGTGDTRGITHHATVPLRSGSRRFGVLNVAAPGKERFGDEELALFQAVAFQIGSAVERMRLEQYHRELARLEERNRLARDLHDSVCQMLFSLSMTARAAESMIGGGQSEPAIAAVRDMQQLAQSSLKEMRALIMQLRPAGLEDGLVSSLKRYGEKLGLKVQADVRGVRELPRPVEEALWRIGQEALNNIVKHAGTKEAVISLEQGDAEAVLRIHDRGSGMKRTAAISEEQADEEAGTAAGTSFGLITMKERAESLGGRLSIATEPEKGTSIAAAIPLFYTHADRGENS